MKRVAVCLQEQKVLVVTAAVSAKMHFPFLHEQYQHDEKHERHGWFYWKKRKCPDGDWIVHAVCKVFEVDCPHLIANRKNCAETKQDMKISLLRA